MKKQILRMAMAIGFSAALGSALLIAQSSGAGVAEVPFDFQILNQTLEAGTYAVVQTNASSVLMLRNQDTGNSIAIMAGVNKSGKAGDARLVFNRYGDRYFLSQVWFAGDEIGHGLMPGKLEREVAKTSTTKAGVLATIHMK